MSHVNAFTPSIVGQPPTRRTLHGLNRALLPTPTDRERELIALIALGLQNKVIAYRMNISPNTVRVHIGNIMRKYKLNNRTQIAVMLAAQFRT